MFTSIQVSKNKDLHSIHTFMKFSFPVEKNQSQIYRGIRPPSVILRSLCTPASTSSFLRLPFPPRFSAAGIVDQLIRGGADRTAFHAGSRVISPMQLPGVPSVTPLHPRIYPNIRRL